MVFIFVLLVLMCMFLCSGNRAASINPVVAYANVDSKPADLPAGVITNGEFVGVDRIHKGFLASDGLIFGYNADGDFLSQGVI